MDNYKYSPKSDVKQNISKNHVFVLDFVEDVRSSLFNRITRNDQDLLNSERLGQFLLATFPEVKKLTVRDRERNIRLERPQKFSEYCYIDLKKIN